MNAKMYLYAIVLLLYPVLVYAQSGSGIKIPPYRDSYSEYIRLAEAMDLDLNYEDFRLSFRKSEQYEVTRDIDIRGRLNEMKLLFEKGKELQAAEIAKELLGINYTMMYPHLLLHNVYKKLNDTLNLVKHYEILIGLVSSILKSGDGKTCGTGWLVLDQFEEEYIVMIYGGTVVDKEYSDIEQWCKRYIVEEEDKQKTFYLRMPGNK